MITPLLYIAAALAEIAGCFSVWAWWRLEKTPLWLVPGVATGFAVYLLLRLNSGTNK